MNGEPVRRPGPDAVEAAVRQCLGGRLRELRVQFCEGSVVLRGAVTTYHAKQIALHVVMKATGLPVRGNELEVRGSPPEADAADGGPA